MDRDADADARRKIQFSVPSSVPTQLDPRQVEMIRRRRPTPATLFRLTDPPSPEEESSPHQVDVHVSIHSMRAKNPLQWALGENGALKAKLVHMSTYQPPSLKAVQKMAQAHLSSLDMRSVDIESSSGEEEEQHDEERQQKTSDPKEESKPQRERCGRLDSPTESLCHHHKDKEEAKERQEEKGE
ncbi:protein phosphatase 1 regulatory subunit 1B-like isoform X3 [Archocentrus centrarchus]|uniref:protein phosphatase 1 regulatory subunit 1B-like isoform X3 n=1 Tax=Archocentrus centrarchus TaxID=63155 RepID=UPI0011EA1269|nr:protein phosphatase 1 regulatory subunit 1B-like isoform X3 [Archocentrus centrarchus]